MNTIYIREPLRSFHDVSNTLNQYAAAQGLTIDRIVTDTDFKTNWQDRQLHQILTHAQKGDHLIVLDAPNLTNSLTKLCELLTVIAKKQLTVHFQQYHLKFQGNPTFDTHTILKPFRISENDFIAKRARVAMAKRKAEGLHVGRPKGRTNTRLKLDPHKAEIALYLKHGISKTIIAKRLGCHTQTLYNFLQKAQLVA